MSEILIKKQVSLDFLGKEYEGSFLVFRSMSVKLYQDFQTKVKKVKDNEAVYLILDELKGSFISGKLKQGEEMVDLTAEDFDQFDPDTLITTFEQYTGAKPDPKV